VNARAADLWERAKKALAVAKAVSTLDPDSAASRAYYAAFYAVSARFVLEGKTFRKHSAVEAAVHRDLVKAGIWPTELGQGYSKLSETCSIGDYGELEHVSEPSATEAVQIAGEILSTITREQPRSSSFLNGKAWQHSWHSRRYSSSLVASLGRHNESTAARSVAVTP